MTSRNNILFVSLRTVIAMIPRSPGIYRLGSKLSIYFLTKDQSGKVRSARNAESDDSAFPTLTGLFTREMGNVIFTDRNQITPYSYLPSIKYIWILLHRSISRCLARHRQRDARRLQPQAWECSGEFRHLSADIFIHRRWRVTFRHQPRSFCKDFRQY